MFSMLSPTSETDMTTTQQPFSDALREKVNLFDRRLKIQHRKQLTNFTLLFARDGKGWGRNTKK